MPDQGLATSCKALMYIDLAVLHRLLKLPADVEILALLDRADVVFAAEVDRKIGLLLAGPGLRPVERYARLPVVDALYRENEGGKAEFVKFVYEGDEDC